MNQTVLCQTVVQLLLATESVRAEMESGSAEQAGCNGVVVLGQPTFPGSPYSCFRITLEECDLPPDESEVMPSDN